MIEDKGIYRGGMHDENKEPIMHFIGNTFEQDLEIHISVKEIVREAEKSYKEYIDWLEAWSKQKVEDDKAKQKI